MTAGLCTMNVLVPVVCHVCPILYRVSVYYLACVCCLQSRILLPVHCNVRALNVDFSYVVTVCTQ